ncbi:MAG: flagellar basal body rod protein FlgB [Clostridiales bacterium]|nr:flagellar basal body rod protein FlgB [Clostridiales bacterium]
MGWLDSVTLSTLNKDLDGLWKRQEVISDNLANVETPNYNARVVSFEKELKAQLDDLNKTKAEKSQGVKDVKIATTVDESTYRLDGSGVDVEEENVEMARTQLNYMYSLRMLSDDFSRLKTAINGQGK